MFLKRPWFRRISEVLLGVFSHSRVVCFKSFKYTLPETNSEFTPENGWSENDRFLLGWLIFRGELLVSGRVIIFDLFTILYVHPEDVNIMFMFCVYTHTRITTYSIWGNHMRLRQYSFHYIYWISHQFFYSSPQDMRLMFKQKYLYERRSCSKGYLSISIPPMIQLFFWQKYMSQLYIWPNCNISPT